MRLMRMGVLSLLLAGVLPPAGTILWAQSSGVPPSGSGGGGSEAPVDDVIAPEERLRIQRMIDDNVVRLGRTRARIDIQAPSVGFTLPLALTSVGSGLPFYGITGFVDHDAGFPGSLLDYQCGTRTYDTAGGYNHQGIDYFPWPFPVLKMDEDDVEVVAAAPGTIVLKDDGNFDRNCSFNSNPWNAVYVMHADGSVAWYGHLKSGSLTTKPVGGAVAQGEFLGIVGSSGNSTGPHLHFEVYDAFDSLMDPYDGACNGLNAFSLWENQPPYYDPSVVRITAGPSEAQINTCPQPETPNESLTIVPGLTAYFTIYYRDQRDTSASQYSIFRPDGSVFSSWQHTSNASHYSTSQWFWFWNNFSGGGPTGPWRLTVDYESNSFEHEFYVVSQCQNSQTVTDSTISGPEAFAATQTLTAGANFTVEPTGSATLLAGNAVRLDNGVSIRGELKVRLGAGICGS